MLWRKVAGVFIWLLFGIDISGNALWLLPILSLLCVLLKDGFMIRWGHMEAVTKNKETGELRAVKWAKGDTVRELEFLSMLARTGVD